MSKSYGRCSRLVARLLFVSALLFPSAPAQESSSKREEQIPWVGKPGVSETVQQIMERQRVFETREPVLRKSKVGKIRPDRRSLPQNPASPATSSWPVSPQQPEPPGGELFGPQTPGLNFKGATLFGTNPTFAFPPDNMGAVGPSQYVVGVNGRIVTFNKTTGNVDGALNADTDVFFASVMTPLPATFTSDPRVRYDRLSGRWIVIMIDVAGGTISNPNRVLIAVSSGNTITSTSSFTFFQFRHDLVSPAGNTNQFADYPTLGVDANALYVGVNVFTAQGFFSNTTGFVVRKSSIIGAGPIAATAFRNLIASGGNGTGPYTPQGVDNLDPGAAEGYFVGVDNASFGVLTFRRISNPAGTPTISSNFSLTVPGTGFPIEVRHLGNTGGSNGYLDGLDDRLFDAVIRNGRLWTSHNIAVNNTGVAGGTRTRNSIRWYEIGDLSTTPTLIQSGTVFASTVTNSFDERNYWIPGIMVSGQGHVALGFSTAGTNEYVNAGTVGRLASDPLGTMQTPVLYTASSTAYNPPGNPGGSSGRRWGDYSYTSVDPDDDMTMWTVQQYCDTTNSYGCRVVKLIAPPPATPSSASPAAVLPEETSLDVVITGTSIAGSGFFDPGPGFPNRISATVSGGVTVNSVTYNSPTSVTLNISTTSTPQGLKDVTIINPDGQSRTGVGLINVDPSLPVQIASFTGYHEGGSRVRLDWMTISELNNYGFHVQRTLDPVVGYGTLPNSFIPGHGTTLVPQYYTFTDSSAVAGRLYYRLQQIDLGGPVHYTDGITVDVLTGVSDEILPSRTELLQNYPNPFNPATVITLRLAEPDRISLRVYDLLGREVAVIYEGERPAGEYRIEWMPRDLANGVYIYRMKGSDFVQNKRLMLLK